MKPTILLLIIPSMNTLIHFVVHFVKDMVIPSFTSFVNVSLVVNTMMYFDLVNHLKCTSKTSIHKKLLKYNY